MYKELFDLKEKIVVITGGANGIGLACSHAFLEFGAKVIILDLYKKETDYRRNFLCTELEKVVGKARGVNMYQDFNKEKSEV